LPEYDIRLRQQLIEPLGDFMKNIQFGIPAMVAAVAAALVAVGCGPSGSGGGSEVKIGHVGPLTGGIAHLGKDNENGARLAIEEANAAKTKIDGKEVKFTLVAEDDQADPKVGTTVAQKLVDAKVVGVVGHLNSGTSIPASPIYNQAGIPVISGSATNPKLTEQGFKTQFRVVGRDDQQGPAIASYLATNTKPQTVAVIDDATAYGEGIANEVEKTLKAAKINVLPREKGTDKTTDWKAVLTKLRGRNPDAVFYGGMDATGGPLLKQGRELGIKAVFSFGDGACTDKMKELAGDASEGLLCSQAGIPVDAADKKFLRRGQDADRGDAKGELQRSEEVPAGAAKDRLQRRHRQDQLRRQGRPQGRRDDDLHHEKRQAAAGRGHQGRQVAELRRLR
jgi:branched-chain amino acid transport system substrate-binding protein